MSWRWLIPNPRACHQDGATPLFKAAHKGHIEVVVELLKYKPNLGQLHVSYLGFWVVALRFSLLQDLVFSKSWLNQHQHLTSLMHRYAFLQNGESCLHAAALFGHMTVVRDLVTAGADITLKNSVSATMLVWLVTELERLIWTDAVKLTLRKSHKRSEKSYNFCCLTCRCKCLAATGFVV